MGAYYLRPRLGLWYYKITEIVFLTYLLAFSASFLGLFLCLGTAVCLAMVQFFFSVCFGLAVWLEAKQLKGDFNKYTMNRNIRRERTSRICVYCSGNVLVGLLITFILLTNYLGSVWTYGAMLILLIGFIELSMASLVYAIVLRDAR